MKKNIFLSMLAAIMLLATSCNESADMPQPVNNGTVTFIASIDGATNPSTRAFDATDEPITRAVMDIYDSSDNLVGSRLSGTINGDNITFSTSLKEDEYYSCLIWADGGEDAYDITNLKAISHGENPSIAYFAKTEFTASPTTAVSVNLSHAVAKVVLEETGTLATGDKVGVLFSLPTYTFNVSDGSCTGGNNEAFSKEFTISTTTTGQVGSFYVFAPTDGITLPLMFLSHTPESNGTKRTSDISNVPFKCNYRTVLRGAFEKINVNISQSFNVSLDKNWGGDNLVAQANQGILTTTAAGEIDADPSLIIKALDAKGSLIVEGPVNTADITAIGTWAKANANKLKALDLSATTGLTEMADDTFKKVSSLSSVILPASLLKFASSAFAESGLVEINIPDKVNYLSSAMFSFCSSLQRVKLSENQVSIGSGSFYYCTALTGITLPEGLQNIADYAFESSGLTGISIPASMGYISSSFQNCLSMRYVIFEGTQLVSTNIDDKSYLRLVDDPFKSIQNLKVFLPNVTDEDIVRSYYDYFQSAANTATIEGVYYNYTGDADGDQTDITNYTPWTAN